MSCHGNVVDDSILCEKWKNMDAEMPCVEVGSHGNPLNKE